jgi:lipopolysaccharide biosynthesis protein
MSSICKKRINQSNIKLKADEIKMNSINKIIAFYLPQFHPIPENDLWWGKGFTEWTNVGKAKPLFKGHYQPKVPTDLGYYDLRLPESRQAQVDLAKEYGIYGFCYWHYWFGNGKRLLETPFNEVLRLGKPDFPFCLAWANHSWKDKQFKKGGNDKLLIKQEYPGEQDIIGHFNTLLPAFKDLRYIRVRNKPIFMIYNPGNIPEVRNFIRIWQKLAQQNGLDGIHFVAHLNDKSEIQTYRTKGFDGIVVNSNSDYFKANFSLVHRAYLKLMRVIFKKAKILDFRIVSSYHIIEENSLGYCYPCVISNWDHSPRSGRSGYIQINATPKILKRNMLRALKVIKNKEEEDKIIFLKSWNEWAEGNYVEPCLKYGRGYLTAIREALEESS